MSVAGRHGGGKRTTVMKTMRSVMTQMNVNRPVSIVTVARVVSTPASSNIQTNTEDALSVILLIKLSVNSIPVFFRLCYVRVSAPILSHSAEREHRRNGTHEVEDERAGDEQVCADRASAPYDNDALEFWEVGDEWHAMRRNRRPDCTHYAPSEKGLVSRVRRKGSWDTYGAGRTRRGG